MQFQARWRERIESGEVDLTFRRWKRCQVVAGHRYRTAAGMLDVDEVDEVPDPARITDAEARRSGQPDAAALVADLRGSPDVPVYRVRFHPAGGPDPRDELAADATLTASDVEIIATRLARLDRTAADGPWTAQALQLIADHPAVRAGDLAAMVGRERAPFKLDVRKLKALGLTISLSVGYRLSPRGEAYLEGVDVFNRRR